MLKRGKIITHIPRIKLAGHNIGFAKELKYLGVIFDQNLSWIPHVNYLASKINKLTYKIMNLCRATWGLSPHVIKSIYLAVIEKKYFICK